MNLIDKLECALPLIKKVAAFSPAVSEALKTAERIVGPKKDWSVNSNQVTSKLIDYCNQNNARISDALDELRIGTQSRKFIDSVAPGLAKEAEREISRLSEKQNSSASNSTKGKKYSIFPINKR